MFPWFLSLKSQNTNTPLSFKFDLNFSQWFYLDLEIVYPLKWSRNLEEHVSGWKGAVLYYFDKDFSSLLDCGNIMVDALCHLCMMCIKRMMSNQLETAGFCASLLDHCWTFFMLRTKNGGSSGDPCSCFCLFFLSVAKLERMFILKQQCEL